MLSYCDFISTINQSDDFASMTFLSYHHFSNSPKKYNNNSSDNTEPTEKRKMIVCHFLCGGQTNKAVTLAEGNVPFRFKTKHWSVCCEPRNDWLFTLSALGTWPTVTLVICIYTMITIILTMNKMNYYELFSPVLIRINKIITLLHLFTFVNTCMHTHICMCI